MGVRHRAPARLPRVHPEEPGRRSGPPVAPGKVDGAEQQSARSYPCMDVRSRKLVTSSPRCAAASLLLERQIADAEQEYVLVRGGGQHAAPGCADALERIAVNVGVLSTELHGAIGGPDKPPPFPNRAFHNAGSRRTARTEFDEATGQVYARVAVASGALVILLLCALGAAIGVDVHRRHRVSDEPSQNRVYSASGSIFPVGENVASGSDAEP